MKDLYDDVEELLKSLEADIEDTLMHEVLDEVKEIELRHVEEDVFDVYKPKIYERRDSGGIDDPDNIVGTIQNMEMEVKNITSFASGYGTWNRGVRLTELINDGNSTSGYFYDYPGEFNQPRPFLDNTIEEIERTDDVEDALAKGLNNRKWTVK